MNYNKNFSIKSRPVKFQQERHTQKNQIAGDTVFAANCTEVLLNLALIFCTFSKY